MAHVFISYIHENWDAVARLRDALETYDIDVWLDRERILPGVRWSEAIRDAIGRGAFFIACFSEEYEKKERSYMNEEIIVAIEELRLRPFNRTWFIPVLLSKAEIPNRNIGAGETLRSLQWVDLSENWNEGIKRMLYVINPDCGKVQNLIHALTDTSADIRSNAARNLAQIGNAAQNAIPALLNALGDERETVRTVALETLKGLGVSNDVIVAKLVSIFDDIFDSRVDPYDRITSLPMPVMLVRLGEAIVPAVITEIDRPHKNRHEIDDILHDALIQIGDAVIPPLVDALDRGSDQEKRFIVGVLGNFKEKAKPAVASIVRTIQNANNEGSLKSMAIDVLGNIRDPSVVPFLITLLNDDISNLERLTQGGTAAQALANIGDSTAVPAIVQAIKDQTKSTLHRSKCARAIIYFGDPSVVPILLEIVADQHNDSDLRRAVICALADMWRFRKETATEALENALPVLIDTLQAEDLELRFTAARAVWRITDLVVPVFAQGLKRYESTDRSEAARLLGEVGPEAAAAVPQLLEASKEQTDFVRKAIVNALRAIDSESLGALPKLDSSRTD